MHTRDVYPQTYHLCSNTTDYISHLPDVKSFAPLYQELKFGVQFALTIYNFHEYYELYPKH